MNVTVTYTLDDEMHFLLNTAVSAIKRQLWISQTTYFNLGGWFRLNLRPLKLYIDADFFTPIDADSIPTGEIKAVEGTPFDFRTSKIGQNIHDDYEQLDLARGYDTTSASIKKMTKLQMLLLTMKNQAE